MSLHHHPLDRTTWTSSVSWKAVSKFRYFPHSPTYRFLLWYCWCKWMAILCSLWIGRSTLRHFVSPRRNDCGDEAKLSYGEFISQNHKQYTGICLSNGQHRAWRPHNPDRIACTHSFGCLDVRRTEISLQKILLVWPSNWWSNAWVRMGRKERGQNSQIWWIRLLCSVSLHLECLRSLVFAW